MKTFSNMLYRHPLGLAAHHRARRDFDSMASNVGHTSLQTIAPKWNAVLQGFIPLLPLIRPTGFSNLFKIRPDSRADGAVAMGMSDLNSTRQKTDRGNNFNKPAASALRLRLLQRSNNRSRGGYILLMTIAMLAITALIVAGIARHSMFQATSAKRDLAKLKQKWAVASCQRFCLQNAGQILDAGQNHSGDVHVRLSGLAIANRIEDESAKLDINPLASLVSESELKSVIEELAATSMLGVRLRPSLTSANSAIRRSYETWGQVFEPAETDYVTAIAAASQQLSCWGGKLNIRSADDRVVRIAITSVAGSIMAERILAARRENPRASLQQLLAKSEANESQTRRLQSLLTTRSWATSVWTQVSLEHKIVSYFAVQERPVENIRRYQTIQWP